MNRYAYVRKALVSARAKNDPSYAETLISKYEKEMTVLFEDAKPRISDIIGKVFKKEQAAPPKSGAVGVTVLKEALAQVDETMVEVYYAGEKRIAKFTSQAYGKGDQFASITLNLKYNPKKPPKGSIEARILKSQSDFKGITDAVAKDIKGIIATGVINGTQFGEVKRDIVRKIDGVGIVRASTMVRTEAMKAVNAGVKDRYSKEDITRFERLEALDERTCTDWEFNINGTIYMGCAAIDGVVFTREEADMIDEQTHPNCRGTWVPVVEVEEE